MLIASADPFLAALALIEFDGLARRMTLYPPDLALEHLPYVMRYAEVDAVVSDGSFLGGASIGAMHHALCTPALGPARSVPAKNACRRSGFCSRRAQQAGPRWCCTRWPA